MASATDWSSGLGGPSSGAGLAGVGVSSSLAGQLQPAQPSAPASASHSTSPAPAASTPSSASTSTSPPRSKRPRLSSTTHPPSDLFFCSHAGCTNASGFTRRADLLRPERIHNNDRRWACSWEGCGKSFIQASALTVHTRTHTGDKPHMCEWPGCGSHYADSSSLARHRRVHTGERPHECPEASCPRAFCRKNTLIAHIKRTHPNLDPESTASSPPAVSTAPAPTLAPAPVPPAADSAPSLFSAPATRDELQDFAVVSPAVVQAVVRSPALSSALPLSVTRPRVVGVKEEDRFVPGRGLGVDVAKAEAEAGVKGEGQGAVVGGLLVPPTPVSPEEVEGRPRKQLRMVPGKKQGVAGGTP